MASSWDSNTHFYSTELIENNGKLIGSDSDNDSTCTNLSKMRSYLKRCESAISNISLSGKRSTQKMCTSIRAKQSTSSWYIDNTNGCETERSNKRVGELNCVENGTSSQIGKASMHSLSESQTTIADDECASDHISKIDFSKSALQLVSTI